MEYKIVNGKVQTRALEYHIIDHCNLKCDHCCSFSPILPKWLAEPEQFRSDLEAVKKAVAPQFLKIVGGEPLMHPQLETLLRIAREVQIAPAVSVTTNAHLMKRMPEAAWGLFEMLTVSIYPQPPLSKDLLHWIRRKAIENNIRVSWKVQDKFVGLDRSEIADYETSKTIFQGCWIHHRCNSIKNGRFYSCTRPQYIQKFADNPQPFLEDGVDIHAYDSAELPMKIRQHLESTEPLNSCFLCHGGHAAASNHTQLDAKSVQTKREVMKGLCQKI